MATKIRLARSGAKKRPFYRIVVADAKAKRDGKFIEKVGTYNPLLSKDNDNRVTLDAERIKYWLGNGAKPTERVESFLVAADLFKRDSSRQKVLDARIARQKELDAKKKAEEKAKKDAEEKAKKEAEAAAADQDSAESAQ